MTYVNVFDPQTMSPVYMEFKRSDTGEWARRDFEKAQVKYQRRTSADETNPETGEFEMKEPIFDYNGGMYGILLAALPLKEGFRDFPQHCPRQSDGRGYRTEQDHGRQREQIIKSRDSCSSLLCRPYGVACHCRPVHLTILLHGSLLSLVEGPKPKRSRMRCRNRSRSSGVMCSQRSSIRRRKVERPEP